MKKDLNFLKGAGRNHSRKRKIKMDHTPEVNPVKNRLRWRGAWVLRGGIGKKKHCKPWIKRPILTRKGFL